MPGRFRSGTKVDLIAKVPLFAGLSKRELGQIASIADEIDLPEDKVLIREGERGREFYVLLDGEAEVTRDGKRLATRRSGEFFGEIALVSAEADTCDRTQGSERGRRAPSAGRGLASGLRPFRFAPFRSKLGL